MCENRQSLVDWESLLLVPLEICFRHLDPQGLEIAATPTHTEHHLEMVDVVFKSQKSEAIANLLYYWTYTGARFTWHLYRTPRWSS